MERVNITSHFSVDQLSSEEKCTNCEMPLTPGIGGWLCNNVRDARVVVEAENVPMLQCENRECGGSYYVPEVLVDLIDQALPHLERTGETELTTHLREDRLLMKQQIALHPTIR